MNFCSACAAAPKMIQYFWSSCNISGGVIVKSPRRMSAVQTGSLFPALVLAHRGGFITVVIKAKAP